MGRGILIIDPQCDFITGSLPVPGAAPAMDNLADYILNNKGRYAVKIVTGDQHPDDHCSFRNNGGNWPPHCVKGTQGAAIWPRLDYALKTGAGQICLLAKGESHDREEYSIFIPHALQVDRLLKEYEIDGLEICGLAGDVCVLNTLRDAVARYGAKMIAVLEDFSPSLDGGKKLREFCQREKIACVRL